MLIKLLSLHILLFSSIRYMNLSLKKKKKCLSWELARGNILIICFSLFIGTMLLRWVPHICAWTRVWWVCREGKSTCLEACCWWPIQGGSRTRTPSNYLFHIQNYWFAWQKLYNEYLCVIRLSSLSNLEMLGLGKFVRIYLGQKTSNFLTDLVISNLSFT